MPHALAVIDVTEGSSPRDIPVKQPARYHGSSWHDADDLADATTLVRNPRVNCRASKVCLVRSHRPSLDEAFVESLAVQLIARPHECERRLAGAK